jgi:hypothetical protein
MSTDRQYERFHHLDIAALKDSEVLEELWALRPLLWGLPPDHWLRERVTKLEGELTKRQADTGREFSRRQKPKPAKGVEL